MSPEEETLRDRIAKRVMELTIEHHFAGGSLGLGERIANCAYDIADAMMLRRGLNAAPGVVSCHEPDDNDSFGVGDVHGNEACPNSCSEMEIEGAHHWKEAHSIRREDGVEHPAEKMDLGVWLSCRHCDTWAELANE